jgi:hypothetical protein
MMSEIREERILTELLNEIAREDGHIEAPPGPPRPPDMEHRVMAHWKALVPQHQPQLPYWVAAALAAGLLVALALPRSERPAQEPRETPLPQVQRIILPPPPVVERAAPSREAGLDPAAARRTRPADTAGLTAFAKATAVRRSFTQRRKPGTTAAVAEPQREVLNFVPLVPMVEQELTGPFQLVRVQLSRAAFADFGVPFDVNRLADPVEADVLLGEDGVARAIRFTSDSTNGYPWRSR